MRKTFSAVALAAALGFSGMSYADQATLDALVAAGVQLDPATEQTILEAEGAELVAAIAALVASLDGDEDAIAAVVTAAVSANPELADSIVVAATVAAPESATVIQTAAVTAMTTQSDGITATGSGEQINTNSVPSSGGGGGNAS